MTNDELRQLMKQASVPRRPDRYWDEFPTSLARALARLDPTRTVDGAFRPRRLWRLSWGWGAAAACALGLIIGFQLGRETGPDREPADLGRYLREIDALFPRQVQAIVFENAGPRLILSERADVPDSPAIYLRICADRDQICRGVITFSGQRLRMGEDEFEFFLDAKGGVIVVAGQGVWSSAGGRSASLPFRIEARTLGTSG